MRQGSRLDLAPGPAAADLDGAGALAAGLERLVGCPECGLPAEILDRFSLASTDGPVAHIAWLRRWSLLPHGGGPATSGGLTADGAVRLGEGIGGIDLATFLRPDPAAAIRAAGWVAPGGSDGGERCCRGPEF
jgi:hypothetical protein